MTITWSACTRPLPRKLQFRPARRVTRLVTIFLLSVPRFACLDMVPTSQCRLTSPPHNPEPRPQVTPIQSSRGPSESRTDRPLLTAPARCGAEDPGSCGSADLSQTTASGSSTGSPTRCPARTTASECYERRAGCAIMAARWHSHLVVVLYCPQSVLIFLPNDWLWDALQILLSPRLVLESPYFELSSVAAAQLH